MTFPLDDPSVPLDSPIWFLDGHVLVVIPPDDGGEGGEPTFGPRYVATFMPPEVLDLPRWEVTSSPIQKRLNRFFGAPARSINLYVLHDGTITENQPDSWEDVANVYWGGHFAFLTQAEADALTAAGYADRIMYAPSDGASEFSITSTQISITTNAWDILGHRLATRDHPTWPLPPVT